MKNKLSEYGDSIVFKRGRKFFELTNHLGNVLVTVSDKKLPTDGNHDGVVNDYLADVINAQDYSSYGALLEGRQYGGTPRFTFNGKQLDQETNWVEYGGRDYLGGEVPIFTRPDPLTKDYAGLTPFQFASNSPIQAVDLDGLESLYYIKGALQNHFKQLADATDNETKIKEQIKQQMQMALSRMPVATLSPAPVYTPFQQHQHDQMVAQKRDEAGLNADGSKKTLTILAENKTFNKFVNNVALPIATTAATDGLFKLGGSLISSFAGDAVESGTASAQARLFQANSTNYGGVDAWRDINLKEGQFVVGGLPGQGNFYTTLNGLNRSGLSQEKLWNGLQVIPDLKLGTRPSVGIYQVTENTSAAFGTTYANPILGNGGLPQIFIPNKSKLTLFQTLDLKKP